MDSMTHQTRSAIRNTVFLWSTVTALLFMPAYSGLSWLDHNHFDWRNTASTLGLTGLLLASSWMATRTRRSWAIFAALIILISFFVRMLFAGVVHFSGRDIDTDFFLHLSRESAVVAWQQYNYLFALFALGVLVLVIGFVLLSRKLWCPNGTTAAAIAVVSVLLLAIGYSSTPEWHLTAATRAWFQPKQFSLPNGRTAVWEKSPLVNIDLVSKQSLWAKAATPPKNLIFLYIESGGLGLMESKLHPGLMPNMSRLVAQHGFLPFIWTSSYVTIEGEADTQCGTLLPFEQDSDSMAGFDQMVDQLPCLGDVLRAAGYQQSYLGGAEKSFAGKGKFLSTHGYDKVMGLEDWMGMGLNQRPDTWGLSDVDLFKQSLLELKRLKASGKPFNLTMLTIGTHLPGFPYKECKPWQDGGERFLSATYCSDQLIGKWVSDLKAGGWLDDRTILVITGDHNFFPNPLMNRLFGEKAVQNLVLPLVVVGHDLPKPVQKQGAGYDIAPTVLDLLGVETNARFAMGRSLLRNDRPIEYFSSRYIDFYNGKPWYLHDPFNCEPANTTRIPGRQPLSQCERTELFTILRMQAQAYSAPIVQMRCNSERPIEVSIPAASDQSLNLRISGRQQAGRFTWSERHVPKTTPGLYLVAMDRVGNVLWRKYAAASQAAQIFAARPDPNQVAALVAVWRPEQKDATGLPAWLLEAGANNQRGAWVFHVDDAGALTVRAKADANSELRVDSTTCSQLITNDKQ
jgi:Phosphoglycerol transferase and related proteins, alkaline phosphatase superfamily